MTTKKIRFLFSAVVLFAVLNCASFLYSESILKFKHLTIEDGLSASTVTGLLRDSRGFMWFGTQDGLNRYDGYEFNIFRHQAGNPDSIGDDFITAVLEDQRGNIWVGSSYGGMSCYNPQTGCFRRYRTGKNNPFSVSHNSVSRLSEDAAGRLWIGTAGGGLNLLMPKSPLIHYYRHEPGNPQSPAGDTVRSLYADRDNVVWVGLENGGLDRLTVTDEEDGNGKPQLRFTHFGYDPNRADSVSMSGVWAIYRDRADVLWVGTKNNGLYRFNSESETFSNYKHLPEDPDSLGSNSISAISEGPDNTLWIGTFGAGLNSLPPDREKRLAEEGKLHFRRRLIPGRIAENSSNSTILNIYTDAYGILWIAVFGEGVTFLTPKSRNFDHYYAAADSRRHLSDSRVWSFCEDNAGNLWIGTNNGVDRLHTANGEFTHFSPAKGNFRGPVHHMIFSLLLDQKGVIWAGTNGSGLERIFRSRRNGVEDVRFEPYRPAHSPLLHQITTLNMLEQRNGLILAASITDGFFRIDPDSDTVTHFPAAPETPGGLNSSYVWTFFEDSRGTLWVGTHGGGLNRMDTQTDTFTHFTNNPDDPYSISYGLVSDIHESAAEPGILWVSIYGGGLNRFDTYTGRFKHFGKANGLTTNKLHSILEVRAKDGRTGTGHLWISSNNGLWEFDPDTESFYSYSADDGLQSSEFNSCAALETSDGRFLFGGINGFNAFYPRHIKKNTNVPYIVLTGFKLFNQARELDAQGVPIESGNTNFPVPLSALETIRLRYNRNFFSFQFAALDFTSPRHNRYAYRLQGVDKDWVYVSADDRQAVYTDVKPGQYVFQVKGANSDGAWNETGTTLQVVVESPFWGTLWFKGVSLLVALGFLGQLVRSRFRHLEKQRLENELKLKTDFTAMVVHDLRNPLTAILGYGDMLQDGLDDLDIPQVGKVITRSSEKMLELINDMLDISRFEAGKTSLDITPTLLTNLVDEIAQLMQPLVLKKDLRVTTRFASLPPCPMDKDQIYQVITNLLGNAVKFSPERGQIILQTAPIEFKGTVMQEFSVIDEGPGVPAERVSMLFEKYAQLHQKSDRKLKGTGLGLAVSRMITELHGGQIGYRPGPNSGSEFYFRLPVSR